MDVVFPYRRTEDDFDLRYSLRSLVNIPHDRVIVAGDWPAFASRKLKRVRVGRSYDRYRSSRTNIAGAIKRAGISGEFVVMNDDIFVLRPWRFRADHRGSIDEYLNHGEANGTYRAMVVKTRDLLKSVGVADPLFFGLHTPSVFESDRFLAMVAEFKTQQYLTRTLYGNLFPAEGEKRADVKLRSWPSADLPKDVLSTSDQCGRNPAFRAWIEEKFPTPSVYEKRVKS